MLQTSVRQTDTPSEKNYMRDFKASSRNYALHKGLTIGKLIGELMDAASLSYWTCSFFLGDRGPRPNHLTFFPPIPSFSFLFFVFFLFSFFPFVRGPLRAPPPMAHAHDHAQSQVFSLYLLRSFLLFFLFSPFFSFFLLFFPS